MQGRTSTYDTHEIKKKATFSSWITGYTSQQVEKTKL